MSTEDPCQAFFPAEPDIAGIGIRISIYVTTILLSLVTGIAQIAGTHPGIAALIVSTAGLQGLVLLITAIIQTSLHQLSLYHAFIIFHLLAFLGVHLGPSYVLRDIARSNENSIAIRITISTLFSVMAGFAYMGWMIYMLVHAPTFGPPELIECNNRVLYVFFFKSVHATTKWVRVVLGIFGVLPIGIGLPLIGPILHAVYGVVTLELMVKRNEFIVDEGEAGWGFGQVLAMILLIAPFKELVDAFILLIDSENSASEMSSPGLLRSTGKLVSTIRKFILRVKSNSEVTGNEVQPYQPNEKATS